MTSIIKIVVAKASHVSNQLSFQQGNLGWGSMSVRVDFSIRDRAVVPEHDMKACRAGVLPARSQTHSNRARQAGKTQMQ